MVQFESQSLVDAVYLNSEFLIVQGGGALIETLIALVDDLYLLDGVLVLALAVGGELSSEDGEAYLDLVEVSACHVDEDVLGIHTDLGGLRVDDGWQGQHGPVGIIEHWVLLMWLQNGQVLLEFLVCAQLGEQLLSIHGLSLLQGLEYYFLRSHCLVGNRSLNLVVVMRSHGAQGSLPADVLMELVLEVDEGVVGLGVELYVSQDGAHHVGSHGLGLRLHEDLLSGFPVVSDGEFWDLAQSQVASQDLRDALEAEQVVSVCCHLESVDHLLGEVYGITLVIDSLHLDLSSRACLDLQTEFKAQIFELLVS